jgi:GntR family transcriptional repressor for pyruvate dehydrogenase complex
VELGGNVTRGVPSSPVRSPATRWYQPLTKTRLSDRVAEAILRSISERGLVPGDQMPTEKQLCEQFGVSRTVIREAVRSLEARGVVRGGPGTGLRVMAVGAGDVSRSMTLFIQGHPNLSYEQVREVRAMIEIEVAGKAAQRATPEDLARLSAAADRLEQAIGSDEEYEADVAFHRLIADATHNELHGVMLDSIADVLVESRRLAPTESTAPKGGAGRHRRILNAILARDPERARTEMRRHLEVTDRVYRRRLAAQRATADPRPGDPRRRTGSR